MFIDKGLIDFNLSRNFVKYDGSQRDTNLVYIFRNKSIEQENTFNTELTYKLNSRSDLVTGFNVKYVDVDYNIILPPFITTYGDVISINQKVVKNYFYGDLYAQYSNTVWDNFRYSFGIRGDYFNGLENSFSFSPRLTISYLLNPVSTFTLHYGKYHQTPAYMYLATLEQNKKLRFIEVDQYIFGFDHRPRLDVLVKVEFFSKVYNKYPTSLLRPYLVLSNVGAGFSGSEDNFSSYAIEPLVSKGKGNSYGVELSMQKKLSEVPCYGIISLTYAKSRFKALDGKERPSNFEQTFIGNLSGGYMFNQEWELALKFRYVTGFPYTPYELDGTQRVDKINTKRYPDKHSLDIRIDKKWFFDNFALITYVDIQNVYNKQEIFYRWDRRQNKVIEQKSIGILPSIGVSLEF
ncbi:MAG TPA: TonB-dependent receptor [Ignavibacteriales bacterium]|nr:TonB-dependent receptor [Ignavibacteriales bacterium]HRT99846.1 TonB-dependent receptor [Ignavibacteriales bacterium]